jgi:hypothetical protein
MNRYYYDFHIHSCLSPCADEDNTPNNLAGIGKLAGLSLMALTDHNSCANCPAFFKAAERYGIIPIAGMELETAEEIHVICLFETLEGALEFDRIVAERRLNIRNKPNIYGSQLICDENDEIIGSDPLLLVCATTITIEEVPALVTSCNGICYPAHIDRKSNSILSVLGGFMPEVQFTCSELHELDKAKELMVLHPSLKDMILLSGSDAHQLIEVRDAEHSIELSADASNPCEIRRELIQKLREGPIQ